jgi:hypothetical protein
MASTAKRSKKRVDESTPRDPRRRKRGVPKQELDFKIIKIWQEEKSTQTEDLDFEWTQEQQNSLEELKIQLTRITRELFIVKTPDSP